MTIWAGIPIDTTLFATARGYRDEITVDGGTYQRVFGYIVAAILEATDQSDTASAASAAAAASIAAALAAKTGVDYWTNSGSNRTVPAGVYWELLNFASTAASFTVTLPDTIVDGFEVTISVTSAITAFTLAADGLGMSFNPTPPTTMAANTSITYRRTDQTWWRVL